MAAGLLFIVAGGPFGEAMRQTYRWGAPVEEVWDVLRWPIGLSALISAVTALFRYCPRRRQPGLSWLAVGGVLTVLTWLGVSGLLAVYVVVARGLDDTYGPLTAMIALLLWANVTGIALLGGVAIAAQVEAVRAVDRSRCSPTATTTASPTARRTLGSAERAVVSPALDGARSRRVMQGRAGRLTPCGSAKRWAYSGCGRSWRRQGTASRGDSRERTDRPRDRRRWGAAAPSGPARHHQRRRDRR